MMFTDNNVGVISKAQAKITDLFAAVGKVNIIDDGEQHANALILLNLDRNKRQLNEKLAQIKLANRDKNHRSGKKIDPILLTDEMKIFIRENSHDMIIFSKRQQQSVPITTLKELLPDPIQRKVTDFELRPGSEWDSGKKDRSINRCNRQFEVVRPYQFNAFKMAPISPGLPNNCDVAFKFIIGDIAAEVENADENLNIVEENNEDNTEPPSKKQKVSAIDREVEMVDLSSGPEYDEVDEKIAAFVRRINEDVTANLNDFQERLFKRFGAEAATCAAEAQAAQPKIMPWNDRSHWGIREDRIIEQAFDGKLKITHEQKCWLEILVTEDPHNPRFRCRICRKHMQRNEKLIKKLRLGMLAEENGAEYPLTSLDSKANFWRKKLRNHCRPDRSHAQIIVGIKDAVFNGQKQCLQQSEKALSQETSIASKVFRTAYVVVKRHISFRIFPDLIKLQQLNGALPAAVSHGNRRSFGRIIGVIARSLRNSLIYTLKTFQPPVSIILDASSDSQNRQFLMVYIQFAHELKPEVRLYKVFEIQSETAAAMKEVILEQFKLDGIYEIMKKKLTGFMSDGAAVMTGWKTGLGTIFNQWVKESDTGSRPDLFRVHCHVHRLQLSLGTVMNKNDMCGGLNFRFKTFVNGLYSFYGKHAMKRTASHKAFAKVYDTKVYQIKAIIQIRWLASQFHAIQTLKRNYFITALHLKNISNPLSKEFDATTKSPAQGFYKQLSSLDFYLYLMFVIDTLDPIKILCECLQKDLYSITRLQTDLDYTLEALAELQDGYGYNVKKFLETAECRKDDEVVPCTIELLKDIAVQVRLPMTDFIKNRNPDGYPSAETFQFTRNSRQLHLDVVRDHLIPGLIEELKSNFPENPEFLKQLNALDPRHLPTGGNTDAITGYAEDLRPVARRFGVNSFAVVEECISFLLL